MPKNQKPAKSAQDLQDAAFRRMSAAKKIRLASRFSMFLAKLNTLSQN